MNGRTQRPRIAPAIREELWRRDGGICQMCGEHVLEDDWNADHIVPKWLGGPDVIDNLRVTHPLCNRQRTPPWRMTDDEIEAAASEWTANEFDRLWGDDIARTVRLAASGDVAAFGAEWGRLMTRQMEHLQAVIAEDAA